MDRAMTEGKVAEAARLLHQAAPGSTVILFGSRARGEAGPESDADFMVVEPEVSARRAETVRLLDVLRPLGMSADVIVVSRKTFDEWADTPNTVIYEAAHEGRVLDEVA